MEFEDTPAEAAFRAEARAFLDAHAPRRSGDDLSWTKGLLSLDPAEEEAYRDRCRAWQRTLFDNGWAGITWPKQYGGRGATTVESMIFNQEAANYAATSGFIAAALQLVGPPILAFGTDEQKQRYIPPLLRGDELWCQLFSEPGAGSDLASVRTRAERDGDEWIVNGQKVWTSAGQHADFGILLARTDPDVPKHKGITFFVLDMKSPGVECRPLIQATGLAEFNEVFFTDVRVPHENVIGAVHEGWKVARVTLASEAGMIGGAGASSGFSGILALAQKLGVTDDPLLRQRLADVWMRERILKFLGMRMQTAILHKNITPPDPSVLKNFFVQSLSKRVELAVDLQGAAGMLLEDGHEDGFWQLQLMAQFKSRIGGGTNEVHRNMIGERALGLPREPDQWHDQPWSETPRS
jgi:alkylation response protein AidB-like acyl-CoA dehydrogenase